VSAQVANAPIPQQAEQQKLRLQFRGPTSIQPEEARREPRQDNEDDRADAEEDERFHRVWSEDQAQRHDRAEVGHETCSQYCLAILLRIEAELDHTA
jgi:hypothetical protein